MATVELRGLGKVYPDGYRAVCGVDLTIDDGELFVLVGPSGCGKTSVLRMVAGLEDISEGEIVIDGKVVGPLATHRRDLAMLFQNTALYPHMTVRENIGFPLKMAKVRHRDIEPLVVRVAHQLGLDDVLDEHPRHLSGGQGQRVAMGRAMVRDPELLLMDEPMSNLDAKLRTELRGEIAAMQRRLGVTTLYVTHDQVEAMSLGDRSAVMRDGRIVQCDTPQALYEHPTDVFVAGFIGSPPMNVVLGSIDADVETPVVRIGAYPIELGAAVARWPTFANLAGRKIAVGVRPESISVDPAGNITVEITHIERIGAEQLVYATLDAHSVTQHGTDVLIDDAAATTIVASLTVSVAVNLWKPIRLHVEPTELHLFDLADGAAVPTAGLSARARR